MIDNTLFQKKYIINGLNNRISDGYWNIYDDMLEKVEKIFIKNLGPDYDIEDKVFFEKKEDAKDIVRQAFMIYSEENKKFGFGSWEPATRLVSNDEIISALKSIGVENYDPGFITSKPFETRQKYVSITERDRYICLSISFEIRVKKVERNICNVEYFGNEYEFEKIETIYSEWFEVKNKEEVSIRIDEHPVYIIAPGALRSKE
jgi:hypothetical protein